MNMARVRRRSRLLALAVLVPVLTLACEIRPEPVHVGSEECAHCSMLIGDRRFAAQLLNTKGKAFKFDSVECLRSFVQAQTVLTSDTHSIWVTDAAAGDGWVAADDATFLHSAALRTPMGGGLAAYATADGARRAAAELGGGHVMAWAEVLAMTTGGGSAVPAAHGGHGAAR